MILKYIMVRLVYAKKVTKLSKCNLLHDILNTPKRTKLLNSRYYPILQGFMNILKGKAKFKTFQIILGSGCGSTIIIGMIINKLTTKTDDVMQCHTSTIN